MEVGVLFDYAYLHISGKKTKLGILIGVSAVPAAIFIWISDFADLDNGQG